MTRFKEKRRIEAAIQYSNPDELKWALEYCKMRLKLSPMAHHEKYWRKILENVENAINIANINGGP